MSDNPLGNTETNGGVKARYPTFFSWTAIVAFIGFVIFATANVIDVKATVMSTAEGLVKVEGRVDDLEQANNTTERELAKIAAQMPFIVEVLKRLDTRVDRIDDKIGRTP